MKACLLLFLVASLSYCSGLSLDSEHKGGDTWAVLVAGSNSYFNYRHQADVLHAYHIVKGHGIPDDRIIVWMYDDIANAEENVHKGVVINRPGGPNLYPGVPKDYTGTDVNAENFLKLLSGADMSGIGSGKSLKSGPKDRVFINLVDHGAAGIFGFPRDFLHVNDLTEALKGMHQKKMYKQMVIYMEACFSGSMFDDHLPNDINIYAMTASDDHSDSYACYWDDELKTFLGDVFSIKWMEDSDREVLSKETISRQYQIVKNETKSSPVCEFGSMDIGKEPVGYYLGMKKSTNMDIPPGIKDYCLNTSIASPDVPVAMMEARIEAASTEEERQEAKTNYIRFQKSREFLRDVVREIVLTVTEDAALTSAITDEKYDSDITDFACHQTVVQKFHDKCFNIGSNPYALRYVNAFNALCNHGFLSSDVTDVINKKCTHPTMINIH